MPLESAINITPTKRFPWGVVKHAGTLVPVADPGAPFDWVIYAQRDRQLAYRDLVLASNIALVTVEATMAWGLDNANIRPTLPTPVSPSPITADVIDRPLLISPSGTVHHMTGFSSPFNAVFVDRELLARDIVIHEALSRASQVVNITPYEGTLFMQATANPPVPALTGADVYLPSISSAWSLAEGTLFTDTINPILPLNVDTFKRPDQNLAARDNILASYTARVEQVLKDPFSFATRIHLEVSVGGLGQRESETYVLAEETVGSKIFQAEPFLPGRLRLIYDKVLRTIQWVSEDPLLIHIPQTQPFIVGGVTVDGIHSGEKLTFIPSSLGRKDAAFWRQKAAKINFAARILDNAALITEPAGAFVSGPGVPSFTSLAITQPGTIRFLLPATLASGSYRVAVLFKPLPELIIPGAQTLDMSTSTPDSGVIFPPDGDTIRWSITLPAGVWTLNLYYTNIAGTAPTEFHTTVSVTGMLNRDLRLRFAIDGLANGDQAVSQIPITTTGLAQIVSVLWAPDVNSSAQLKVFKLVFTSPSSTPIELSLEAKLTTPTGQLGATGTADLVAKRYRADTIAFHYLVLDGVVNPFFDLTLLSSIDAILSINQIQILKFDDIDITPNAPGFEPLKYEFLSRAHESVSDSYASYLANFPNTDFREALADSSSIWTSTSTDQWIAAIRSVEPRIDRAFRPSRCGDIGRLALVPEGLELILATQGSLLAGMVKAHYVAALGLPRLRPLQAWMVEIGLYVCGEDFWDVEDLGLVPFNPLITHTVADNVSVNVGLDPSPLDPYVYADGPTIGAGFNTGTLFATIRDGGTYQATGTLITGFNTGTLFNTIVNAGTYYDTGSSFLPSGTFVLGFFTGTLLNTIINAGTYYDTGSLFLPSGTLTFGFNTGTQYLTAVHGVTYPEAGTLAIVFDTGTLS